MVLAERVSHTLAAERASTDRARADVTAARAGYLPQITLTGSYIRTLASEFDLLFPIQETGEAPGILPFGQDHSWRTGVEISQSIWDGGRTGAGLAIAKSLRDRAELETGSRRAQVVLAVTEAYYGALLAARAVAIGEASLALASGTLAQATLGFEQGTTAEFDVVRAEVTRDNQRTALVRARADRELALDRLRQLIGVPLDRPIELTTELSTEDVGGFARRVAEVPAEVMRAATRVPVAQARTDVEASRAQVRRAQAGWWPQLSAFASFGIVQYPTGFVPDAEWRKNYSLGVNVSFPLFTGGRTSAEVRAARADQRVAEAQLAEVAELAAVDTRRAHRDASVAAATVVDTRRSAALARRAYGIAEVRYGQGVSTYLELADARLALDQAQLNLATAERDLQVARVRTALLAALPLVSVAGSIARAPTAPLRTVATSSPPTAASTTQPATPITSTPVGPGGATWLPGGR